MNDVTVNVAAPNATELISGLFSGVGDLLRGTADRVKNSTDESFLLLTVLVMITVGGLHVWRTV